MEKRYWRIGCKTYFTDEMLNVFDKYPFVWGGAINGKNWKGKSYLTYLQDVNVGDILVAGGVLQIRHIGIVTEKPKYIPNAEANEKDDLFYKAFGIEAEENEAVIDEFVTRIDLEDTVVIKAEWKDIDFSELPSQQAPGGFQPLRTENIEFLKSKGIS